MIDSAELAGKVAGLLAIIQGKRLAALNKLTLTVLLNKNPYLYQSHGHSRPEDFVDAVLAARISSSDETIFGKDFFEPLALWAAGAAQIPGRAVSVSDAAGADVTISDATSHYAIAVKSGTKIFNSQSSVGQKSEFEANQARMKKLGKVFLPLIGYSYGRKKHNVKALIDKMAGQAFWKLLTEEDTFYLRISESISACASQHKIVFDQSLEIKRSALVKEFIIDFTEASGQIDWRRVVQFNSAAEKPRKKRITKAKPKTIPIQ